MHYELVLLTVLLKESKADGWNIHLKRSALVEEVLGEGAFNDVVVSLVRPGKVLSLAVHVAHHVCIHIKK